MISPNPLSRISPLACDLFLLGFLLFRPVVSKAAPLALHPDNPHYFLFAGKPAVLISSGEHYGAILNLDFNYVKYLDTLRQDGLNLTRTFTGAYVEPLGAFNIASNTLAPAGGRFICPWARSSTPGYANGGNKFDLTKWDDAYFRRLKDFVGKASDRGIVVELALFCPFYDEAQWKLSPLHDANNINGLGKVARTNVYTLNKHGGLLAVQMAMVRKIVSELQGFENVIYEICNEPYFGGVTLDWQDYIANVILDGEQQAKSKHLISQNVANGQARIQNPHPAISVFSFHYASPPDAVAMNHGLNKVIGDNETGFKGTNDTHYRMEGWDFILAGGGLYNNLDYSFVAGAEDGTFVYPKSQPGGGSRSFRSQMKFLKEFIHSFEFIKMKPDSSVIKSGLPDKARARVLAEPGRQYAVYIFGGPAARLTLAVPAGTYRAEWLNPETGQIDKDEKVDHPGGNLLLSSPPYARDVALRLVLR